MKTDRYNNMISAFQCDFTLARDTTTHKLADLDDKLMNFDTKLLHDIKLLEELEFNLRYGKVEIHIVEDGCDNEDGNHYEGVNEGVYEGIFADDFYFDDGGM